MPLLLCPNDNASMQTVDRSGVQFDMCPTCRGVWLDRGELEKLLAADAQDAAPPPQADPRRVPPPQAAPWGGQPAQQPYNQGYGERGERGEYGERGEGGYGGGYRKKRGSIFDIFD